MALIGGNNTWHVALISSNRWCLSPTTAAGPAGADQLSRRDQNLYSANASAGAHYAVAAKLMAGGHNVMIYWADVLVGTIDIYLVFVPLPRHYLIGLCQN
jgi:hypothetical protein